MAIKNRIPSKLQNIWRKVSWTVYFRIRPVPECLMNEIPMSRAAKNNLENYNFHAAQLKNNLLQDYKRYATNYNFLKAVKENYSHNLDAINNVPFYPTLFSRYEGGFLHLWPTQHTTTLDELKRDGILHTIIIHNSNDKIVFRWDKINVITLFIPGEY